MIEMLGIKASAQEISACLTALQNWRQQEPGGKPEAAREHMIWALLNRYAGGRRIVSATLPVRHDRGSEAPVGLDLNRLVPDT